jgi:hypothetical protein
LSWEYLIFKKAPIYQWDTIFREQQSILLPPNLHHPTKATVRNVFRLEFAGQNSFIDKTQVAVKFFVTGIFWQNNMSLSFGSSAGVGK